ncbi:hypothetical protein QPK31_23930 [Massilia sp. YIM B02769]|uniref:hypothetical protein n=1 Tax=Massilia sp. YIM B02769 TaxID=3050129 RepID=UPI0025B6BFF0|nr:hypothetical protein [Massilia sp. YIM B02769]MDN4061273.1 hypothetical protein [Massilia sp. YIM B02769]
MNTHTTELTETPPDERLYCEPAPFEGIELERQKFEAWATGKSGPWLPEALARDDFGYKSTEVREHWSMWVELATRRVSTALAQGATLPKTGIKVTDITQLQRDLARHAAGGNIDVAATCVQAQAVIEGLLSGLDAGQLA